MSVLYSSVLAADSQYSDLVDCSALYGVTKLRVTVDRGSARVYCGASPDAMTVLQDCPVGVTNVRLPMLPYVSVARLSGNSSAIKVEVLGPEASELPLTSEYSVSGGGKGFQASGRQSDYISRFDGASISGVLGKPEPILFVANTLVSGRSQIAIRVRVRKTGADTGSFLQLHVGPANSTADTNVFQASGITPSFTSINPYDVIFTILLTYKSGGFGVSWQRDATNVGAGLNSGECTGIDATVDNYVNFAISGAASGSTYDLISYQVTHQPSFLASPDPGAINTVSAPISVPEAFFGLNAQDWPSSGSAPTFSFGSYSNFDNNRTHWNRLHTSANNINWANLDAVVTAMQAAGVTDGTYVLYGTPTFLAQGYPGTDQSVVNGPYSGGSVAGEGSYPTNLSQLTYFCQQFASRNASTWGGFFKRVQLFNEPEGGNFSGTANATNFFWGTATQYVDMLWTAYSALKAADSSLVLLTPGTYNMTTFATWLGTSGTVNPTKTGKDCFDAVALHPYHAAPNGAYSARGDFVTLPSGGLRSAATVLAAAGRTGLDYYATEYGLDSSGSTGVVAAFLARTAAERKQRMSRLIMAAARTGWKRYYLWSLGNANNLCGNLATDTTGVIAGIQETFTAVAGKTITAGGFYTDGREWLTFSDGGTYVV